MAILSFDDAKSRRLFAGLNFKRDATMMNENKSIKSHYQR
jgi:hypothetical protein